jgi:transcriptional regulator with XRE-family HTH domain
MAKVSAFFAKLETLCKSKGVSIAKMQRDCGLGTSTSYRWKTGEIMPNVATVNKIAKYFNVSPNELMPPYNNSEDICNAHVACDHRPPLGNEDSGAAAKGEHTPDLIAIIRLQHETLCEQLRIQNEQVRIQNKKNDDLVEIINNLTKPEADGKAHGQARGRAVDLAGVRGV